jgi:hypothetical protein
MRPHTRYWLAAFRKWRRAISAAVVLAFAWWSLSAAACFGMPLDVGGPGDELPAVAHAAHDASSPHAAHDTANDMLDHAGVPDCAHCPPEADVGQATPTICVTDGTSNANGPKASASPDFFKLFTESRPPTLSWTAPPPPPILAAVGTEARHLAHTPLNVRYCVFLI